MMKNFLSCTLIVILIIGCTSVAKAGGMIEYVGVNLNQASINIDNFGATSVEDESVGYKLFAASRLHEHFYLEYGYQDLGEYKADYDFTVGTFRFVESHNVNFSQSIFVALKVRSSISKILEVIGAKPFFKNAYLYFDLGGLLWQAELDMDGFLYDGGAPFGPYGASGDDIGFSGYHGYGLGCRLSKKIIMTLNKDVYHNVGRGVQLQLLDGSQKEYAGRDIESIGLSLSYLF